ncbi:MAG: hypothetical protein PHG66_02430 [Candidatus Colwellbacteria bacterium]|nr:hypothetical protein [Candidatus Colwellbacteria bacterium]
MKDSTKRFYGLLASFGMALGALIVFATLVVPAFQETQQLRGDKQAKQNEYDDYKKTIEETNKVISRSQSISALKEAFSQSVPTTEDIPSVLNQIYGMAKLNNVLVSAVDFQSMAIDPIKEGDIIKPTGKVRVTVKAISNYSDMRNFTRALETNVRLMDIYTFDISEGNKKDPILSYAITVDAYYQPE